MLRNKLISIIFIALSWTVTTAGFGAGGSLPLTQGGGGSLPLRTTGHAMTLGAAVDEPAELQTEVNITMIDEEAVSESLVCQGDAKASVAKGTLKIGATRYAITALCFDSETQGITILALRDKGTSVEQATLRAVLDTSEENRRSLKGRLTIKDAEVEARRFVMEAEEAAAELATVE